MFLMASASYYLLRLASASVSASRNFVSGFRSSIGVLIKPSFISFASISICLQAPFSPPSARRATYAFPAPVERLFSVAGKVFRPEGNRLSDEFFETLMVIRCNGGDV